MRNRGIYQDGFGSTSNLGTQEIGPLRLVLVRHGQHAGEADHRWTGWADEDLTKKGEAESRMAGALLAKEGWTFDFAFTSSLKRSIRSQWLLLERLDQVWLPVFSEWRLNDTQWGDLTGRTVEDAKCQYGAALVDQWCHLIDARPGGLGMTDVRRNVLDQRYAMTDRATLPLAESFRDVISRVRDFWAQVLRPSLYSGRRVLVCAHEASIRALIGVMDELSDHDVRSLEIPRGVPLVYWFDGDVRPLGRCYLERPVRPIESAIYESL